MTKSYSSINEFKTQNGINAIPLSKVGDSEEFLSSYIQREGNINISVVMHVDTLVSIQAGNVNLLAKFSDEVETDKNGNEYSKVVLFISQDTVATL